MVLYDGLMTVLRQGETNSLIELKNNRWKQGFQKCMLQDSTTLQFSAEGMIRLQDAYWFYFLFLLRVWEEVHADTTDSSYQILSTSYLGRPLGRPRGETIQKYIYGSILAFCGVWISYANPIEFGDHFRANKDFKKKMCRILIFSKSRPFVSTFIHRGSLGYSTPHICIFATILRRWTSKMEHKQSRHYRCLRVDTTSLEIFQLSLCYKTQEVFSHCA